MEIPLLRVTSTAGTVEILGPFKPPAGLMRGIAAQEHGRLVLKAHLADNLQAAYLDPAGQSQEWSSKIGYGPLLYEEQTYQIWINGQAHPPLVLQRDPLFARDITVRPEHRAASGTFNLQRQVGTLRFQVGFGAARLDVELEVVPTKIDYATDYQALISEVAGTARGLALSYLRSTSRGGTYEHERSTELEWLTSIRQRIDRLQEALQRVNARPHRNLLRVVRPTPNYRIRRLDAVTRRAILQGRGSGPFDDIDGIGPMRRVLDNVNAVATLDTPEHRWLNMQMRYLHRQLEDISIVLEQENTRSSARTGERRRAERDEVARLARTIAQLLALDVLQGAQQMPQPSPPSLTLLGAPGYRDAYQILTELRLGLAVGGDALDLQTKDIHDLYELWCFIEVVRLVALHAGTSLDPSALVQTYSGGLRIDLRAGKLSDVTLGSDRRRFIVSYNRTYPGQTGDQKPDIVIRVSEPAEPALIIVLDAKYRVDATPEYRAKFGAPGPPIDAINALHRYRDAIVTEAGEYRPVVRGAALFPLTAEETAGYSSTSALYSSLGRLGIGALPFLPDNTGLAAEWLGALLELPRDQLSWNGPAGPIGH